MIIEKIDDLAITPGLDISPCLNFKAGKPTALSIFDPAKSIRFVVTIKPIGLENSIRYFTSVGLSNAVNW
jgi:hypothetical protein